MSYLQIKRLNQTDMNERVAWTANGADGGRQATQTARGWEASQGMLKHDWFYNFFNGVFVIEKWKSNYQKANLKDRLGLPLQYLPNKSKVPSAQFAELGR